MARQLEIELAVTDFMRFQSELKKLLLEVEGPRAPVPHSWGQ